MKPPVAHQPVQPPRGNANPTYDAGDDSIQPPDQVAADGVRDSSTMAREPGRAAGFGPRVEPAVPDFDFDPATDRERRAH